MSRKISAYARKRTRCPPRLVNPLHLIESQQLVAQHAPDQTVSWGLRGRLSLDAAMKGSATKEDVCNLIAVQAIVASFVLGGVGAEYADVAQASKSAIDALQIRHTKTGSGAISYEERIAIANVLNLHDALMEIATVRMMEQAYEKAVASIQVLKELK